MSEVILEFPYLTKENERGVMLSGSSKGVLDRLINYSNSKIPVTLYPSRPELNYAIDSPARYSMVDIQFQVGNISGFNPSNGKVYVDVTDDNNIPFVENGKVLPRMRVKKVSEGNIEKLEIVDIISLDILQ